MRLRARLGQWHVWLGWLVVLPLLFWVASGLFMASFPIEDVRGTALRQAPPPLARQALVLPRVERAVETLSAEQQARGPRWIITYYDGGIGRADALTGALLGDVDEAEARAIADASYFGKAKMAGARFFGADANPVELRQGRPAWQIAFDDGTRFYVDAQSGRVLAVRTALWRAYDLMWGLHILDLSERENTHHPLLYGLAAVALAMTVLGAALLPMTIRRRRKRSGD